MTKEEAILLIKSAQLMLVNPKTNEPISDLYEALDMAIKALEQEPCDDCVSRQEVEELLRCGCAYDIWNLPSVIPKREQGEWLEVHPLQEDDGGAYMCSQCRCGHPYIAPHWKYCPNCGAEMR